MTSSRWARVTVAAVILIAAIVLLFGAWRVSGMILSLQAGIEPPSIDRIGAEPHGPTAQTTWLDAPVEGDFPAGLVSRSYDDAWLNWSQSTSGGTTDHLNLYFAGPALAAVTAGVDSGPGTYGVIADSRHHLRVEYVHPEKWLVVLTDVDATVVRNFGESTQMRSTETYRVVMVEQDGRWVIRQLVRQAASAEGP